MSIPKDAIESYMNAVNVSNPKELENNCLFSNEKRLFKSMASTENKETIKKTSIKQPKSNDGEWEKVSQKFKKNVAISATGTPTNTPLKSALDQNWRNTNNKPSTPSTTEGNKRIFGTSEKFKPTKNCPLKKDDILRNDSFNISEKTPESILTDSVGKNESDELEVNTDFGMQFNDPTEQYNNMNLNELQNVFTNQWNHVPDQGNMFGNSFGQYGYGTNGFQNNIRIPFVSNHPNMQYEQFPNSLDFMENSNGSKQFNLFGSPSDQTETPIMSSFSPFLPYENEYGTNTPVDHLLRLNPPEHIPIDHEIPPLHFNPLQMFNSTTLPFTMNSINHFDPDIPFAMNNIYDNAPSNGNLINQDNCQQPVFKGGAMVMVEILPYPKWHHCREQLQWIVLSVEGNQSGPYDALDLSKRFTSGDLSPFNRFIIYDAPFKRFARLIDLMKTANERNPFVAAQSPRLRQEFLMVDYYYKEAGEQMNIDHWKDFIFNEIKREKIEAQELSSRNANKLVNNSECLQEENKIERNDNNLCNTVENEGDSFVNGEKIDERDSSDNLTNQTNSNNKASVEETTNWISTGCKKKSKKGEQVTKGPTTVPRKGKTILNSLETVPKTQVQKPPILSTDKNWDVPKIIPDEQSQLEKEKLCFNLGDIISKGSNLKTNKTSPWSSVTEKDTAPVNFAETLQKTNQTVSYTSTQNTNNSAWNKNNDRTKEATSPVIKPSSPIETSNDKGITEVGELEVWLREKLKQLKKDVDHEVFCSFIIDIENPSEIEDYFFTYFGDTSSIRRFIKQFLEKRSEIRARSIKAKISTDDLSAPAQAVGFTIQTSKKNKKQKTTPVVAPPSQQVVVPQSIPVVNNNSHSYSTISANLHIPSKNVPIRATLLSSSKQWESPNIVPDEPDTYEKVPIKFSLGDLIGGNTSSTPTNRVSSSSSAWSNKQSKSNNILTNSTQNSSTKITTKVNEGPWKTVKNVKK
uniref:GYF domain-containing protein n=1 Tax=Parastrongyloides trichosuri TaxID=131310 RepID=A0A0N4Z5V3_PARTI